MDTGGFQEGSCPIPLSLHQAEMSLASTQNVHYKMLKKNHRTYTYPTTEHVISAVHWPKALDDQLNTITALWRSEITAILTCTSPYKT